ncbi:glycosyltransferase family 8 protein [Falsirhodobacter algicola]|uniref:Lipopolysaccharide biosynthesis glycosyltransferase n=1 Tax=Falsirhodobacter algicola TaxID=2692330 RepID=A0A8J8MRJ8_9RHOB|nr:glycosyltransferase family 8 protein [Falsirhodobacter algicola]QUS35214.1 hypothetical protein GR316_02345 [Falsirhodobacter algicola]
MMTQKNTRIAYGLNMGLIGPTALSLWSAIRSTPSLGHVEILDVELTEAARDILRRIAGPAGVAITFHAMQDSDFDAARHKGRHVPKAALARLFLPRLVEDRVLYIDGDTLVRRDLAEAFTADLEGKPLGAVRDFGCLQGLDRVRRGKSWSHREVTEQLVAPFPVEDYFNSGVLLMDCAAIRNEGTLAQDMITFDRAQEYRTVDQDFLNELFKGRVKHLNPAWNASWGRTAQQRTWIGLHGHDGPETQREADGIYHFHGPLKPWRKLPSNRWRRSIPAVARYKLALRSFRKAFPDVPFD